MSPPNTPLCVCVLYMGNADIYIFVTTGDTIHLYKKLIHKCVVKYCFYLLFPCCFSCNKGVLYIGFGLD